ncbi:hypothetical protein FRC10_003391 [Ceratobasidium sp. 414]|nr:hypothetical protein FRC10_003391 [Ceratobasidium sp. 414]
MQFTVSTIIAFISMGLLAQAHPGDHDDFDMLPASELAARELAANARSELVRNCAPQIAAFEAERRAKRRSLMKRATSTSTAAAAKYTTIQNRPLEQMLTSYVHKTTCVTAPEVTEGPYYINNEYYRTDLRESQKGVNLVLDIGIMDTRTCKPLPAALVELWACNATGAYGGFTTSGSLSDKFTWLRGGSETNANGVVEAHTGRTIHIHTMVHTDWTKSANGQVITNLLHIDAQY